MKSSLSNTVKYYLMITPLLTLNFFACSSDDDDAFSKGSDQNQQQQPEVLQSVENKRNPASQEEQQPKAKVVNFPPHEVPLQLSTNGITTCAIFQKGIF